MESTHYDTLQVARTANEFIIRAAFKALSQKYHPDKNLSNSVAANAAMQSVNVAYQCLSNPVERKAYDDWLSQSENSPREREIETRPNNAEKAKPNTARGVKSGFVKRAWLMLLFASSVGMVIYGSWFLFSSDTFAWKTLFVIGFWLSVGNYSYTKLFPNDPA
jgi:curved DNA-binding protein CbpA